MFGLSFFLNEYTILIGVLGYVFYKWSVSTFDYFEQRGLQCDKPVPFFGNSLPYILCTDHIYNMIRKRYLKFKESKVYGAFDMRQPVLIVRDPEIIKQLTVKNFESFLNHRAFIDGKNDAIFAKNLFAMKDQRWRDMRATISPCFTGSKMREMFNLIVEVSDRAMSYLREEAMYDDLVLDTKDITSRLSTDYIASTAFGLEVNSFKDKKNEFYSMGKILSFQDQLTSIKIFLKLLFPKLCNLLGIRIFSVKLVDTFTNIIVQTMNERKKSGEVRRDVIQLLMEIQDGATIQSESIQNDPTDGFATVQESAVLLQSSKTKFDLEDLVAQCFAFFIGGFENVAMITCFAIQELVENSDVQQSLYEEVKETKLQLNGNPISYEIIQKMSYLDQVVSETFRKWPIAPEIDRLCNKPYVLEVDGKSIQINVVDIIVIPIYGMHHDPEFFENPEKFDPSRFSDENKHNIKPFTYMPFGVGPRNCIASRFALMEVKAVIYSLVSNFELLASEKTQIPLIISKKGGFAIKPEKGFWVKLRSRK